MALRKLKIASLGVSTIFLLATLKKIEELKGRKRELINIKEKLRRKIRQHQKPVKLQKSTLELYDSDSEAQRAKRPRLDEEEQEKSEDDDSIESIESSSDSDSSDESCYSSIFSNSESDSTHSESFITDTDDDDILDDDDTADDIDYDRSNSQSVKPEPFDDPLSTINYDDEDRKPDLDELTEALRNADKDNDVQEVRPTTQRTTTNTNTTSAPSSTVRIKEEPRYY